MDVQLGQWLHAGRAYSSQCVTLASPKTPPKWQKAGRIPWICFAPAWVWAGAGTSPEQQAKGSGGIARSELCAAAPSRLQQCEMYQMASPSSFRALTCSQCPCPPVVLQPPRSWVTQQVWDIKKLWGLGSQASSLPAFSSVLPFGASPCKEKKPTK